jgi:hypothetical protein
VRCTFNKTFHVISTNIAMLCTFVKWPKTRIVFCIKISKLFWGFLSLQPQCLSLKPHEASIFLTPKTENGSLPAAGCTDNTFHDPKPLFPGDWQSDAK